MKHRSTYRESAQRGVELADEITKHGGGCTEHDVFCITKFHRCGLAFRKLCLEHICERIAVDRVPTDRDLAVPVRLCKFILEARTTTKTVKVLRETREAIYSIFIGIATATRQTRARATTEPFTLCLGEILLQPCERSLVVRDGFGYLLLRGLVELVFE
jgi:hypothetical protein